MGTGGSPSSTAVHGEPAGKITDSPPEVTPAPGGKLEAPLTQDKVDDVFGEGNATLDNTANPSKITIDNSITPEKPIEVETDVTIDLGGNTITGKPGQPPIIVGNDNKVTVVGGGTVAGGDGTTGGNGIQSGGNVTVDGSVSGGNGASSGNATINKDGEAIGGSGGSDATGSLVKRR